MLSAPPSEPVLGVYVAAPVPIVVSVTFPNAFVVPNPPRPVAPLIVSTVGLLMLAWFSVSPVVTALVL
jgi:hypothetical protein